MVGMARYPDKYFELAIVDPPYGIGGGVDNRNAIETRSGNNLRRLARRGGMAWDRQPPTKEYFAELERVTKNRIVWGGNYMIDKLSPTRCLVVWDKMTYIPSMCQIEVAWTSFDEHSRLIKINSNQEGRIHISQKPVALYTWLLKNYAKEGDKILDTHGGSMSSVIAAIKGGFDITCFELDKDYYEKAKERIENFIGQENMFAEKPIITFS